MRKVDTFTRLGEVRLMTSYRRHLREWIFLPSGTHLGGVRSRLQLEAVNEITSSSPFWLTAIGVPVLAQLSTTISFISLLSRSTRAGFALQRK